MEILTSKTTVGEAMFEVKGFEWEGDYRSAARAAIKEMLESQIVHWAGQAWPRWLRRIGRIGSTVGSSAG